MKVIFKTSFFRDVKKSPISFHSEVNSIIIKLESSHSLKEIQNLKKLKGHTTAYRIKINTYRFCFYFENESVIIARFLPRKDVYRSFP